MTHDGVVDSFHKLFYESWLDTWANTRWLGVASEKPPLDLWVYQEIIAELRPDFIIETGTRFGGSALFMASICELLGSGRVITIDIDDLAQSKQMRPPHPRIQYVSGSSTSKQTVAQVRETVADASCVMVVLDSDHSMNNVLDELRVYGELVTSGSYLIVEDTQFNGHPIVPDYGPGPMEAVEVFLKGSTDFVIDRSREKFLLTFNPKGYLRKIAPGSAEERIEGLRHELLMAETGKAERDTALAQLEAVETEKAAGFADRDAALAQLEAVETALTARISDAEQQISDAEQQISALDAQVCAVEASSSWRLTAPLRGLGRLVFPGRDR